VERLKRIAKAAPELTDLARAVSLCVRAEPELLRAIRVMLFPQSGAWIEADLYFSGLVAQRTPDWIVLAPEFAEELRTDLSRQVRSAPDERQRIGRIRHTIEQAHGSAPFEIQREEEVNWLAVERHGGTRRAKAAIDRKLCGMLARLFRSPEESLATARWFVTAAHRMPKIARETPGFALLAFGSSSVLGGRAVDQGVQLSRETFDELSRYLPGSVRRRPLWAGLTTQGIHLSFTPLPGHNEIEVPRMDPVVVEVRSAKSAPQLAQVAEAQSAFIPLGLGPVEIRTLTRDVFRLRALEQSQRKFETGTFADLFEYDVYVSNSHSDSEWVDTFTSNLQRRLRNLSGRNVSIFTDKERPAGSAFVSEFAGAIEKSAVLLAIVSPSYLTSEWRRKELEIFEAAARRQTGGIMVESQSRVLNVVYIPVERERLPHPLKQVLAYEFFNRNPKSGDFREFIPGSAEYYSRLDELARDISRMLYRGDGRQEGIYVGATLDTEVYRARLEAEFRARGYAMASLGQELSAARACVLLIGRDEREAKRVLDAIRMYSGIRIVVWTPPDLEDPASWRRQLLEKLTKEPNFDVLDGTEFDGLLAFIESLLSKKKWNVETMRELHTFHGHTDAVYGVALSGDGRRAVSASRDHTMKVWDLETGSELRTLQGHKNVVKGVALSGDGQLAVSASWDDTLKVWDVETGRELRTLQGHSDDVNGVALSGDGRRAVSASWDNTLKVWDVEVGLEFRTLQGHTGPVNGVTLSGDGRRAVSASDDRTLKVWDVAAGRELRTLQSHKLAVRSVALSEDGRRAVSASDDRTLKVWDVETGREVHTLHGHKNRVYGVALSGDGRRAVSASEDHTLKVWDMETGGVTATFTCDGAAYCCAFFDDDQFIAGDAGGRVHLLRLEPPNTKN
jgi:WD40 repeat protein